MTDLAKRLAITSPLAAVITIAALLAITLVVACTTPDAPAPPSTNTSVPATATPTPMPPAATPTDAPAAAPSPTTMPPAAASTTAPAATDTPAPTTTTAPTPESEPEPSAAAGPPVFTLTDGTIARYKVEEVLARTGFKIATGETDAVAGQITFDAAGGIVDDASRIVVQAAALTTDSDRRDGYVRNRTLLTDTYPEVVFIPRSIDWIAPPPGELPDAQDFTITGDLTVRDQTREVTWDANAEFGADGTVTGFASVQFTFDDFGMDKPSVAIVLSVEDEILLELDFVGTMSPR